MSDSNGLTAGWFDDPAGTGALRWWDGAAWTTQLRPKQAPPASVGVGAWILPSPGNGPGTGYSPAAIAAPAQPLAITASASVYPEAPADPVGQVQPQMDYYAQAAPDQNLYGQADPQPGYVQTLVRHDSNAQPAPQADPYVPQAAQADPYAQPAAQPDPFAQLLMEQPSTESPEGPTGSAQTAGVWLLALYPLLIIPVAVLAQTGVAWVLTQLNTPVPGAGLIAVPAAIIVGWVFAGLDIGGLRKRGYRPPSILWMLLLPPIGYFIARSVKLRRDRGKTWPAGILLGISFAGLGAFLAIMIGVVIAVLASFGLLPSSAGPGASTDVPAAITGADPRTMYGIGLMADQDYSIGSLRESTDPYPKRVEDFFKILYLFPEDGSGGYADCSAANGEIDLGSTFPCQIIDLDTSDGHDDSDSVSVTLYEDGSLWYSILD